MPLSSLDQKTAAMELLDLDFDITSLGEVMTDDGLAAVSPASTLPIPGCP